MPECGASIPNESLARLHSAGRPALKQLGDYPIVWEYGIDPKSAPLDAWSGTYHIGNHPNAGSGGSFWVGVEPYTCDSVMQAVTYFTNSGWFVVSENCCPGGHDFRVGDVKLNNSADPIQGSITRIASLDAATCTPSTSMKMDICNSGGTIKAPGSDKGTLLPADCAKICESDMFKSKLGSCLGWSIVPSTVPAGFRQWQGCYLSNTTWDGKRAACPYYADSSGCSSRGVVKYARSCCGASPTAYIINTTVNGKTYTLKADNGKDMNVPLTVLEMYNGGFKCSDLPSSVMATNLTGRPTTFFGKIKQVLSAQCHWTVNGNNLSASASAPISR